MKKWYSLIDKVYRLENLERAYQAVKANNGAPGIDGVTVEAYGKDLKEELDHLHHQLKTGIYEPEPDESFSIDFDRMSVVYPRFLCAFNASMLLLIRRPI
jgi:retron-type reverse transcriptase